MSGMSRYIGLVMGVWQCLHELPVYEVKDLADTWFLVHSVFLFGKCYVVEKETLKGGLRC
jgi:hypothetical protein